MNIDTKRLDHRIIMNMVREGGTVLDLGCGSGELLELLEKNKKIKGQGIEIDEQAIYSCVAKGLSVFHGDLDTGLEDYSDKSFDYVILNESLQEVKKPDVVLTDALRVGRKVIVGFPNFVYYRSRFQLFFQGRTPITPSLPYEWHDTPNLHFLSIMDFMEYCKKRNIKTEKTVYLNQNKVIQFWPNWFAQTGIFQISK